MDPLRQPDHLMYVLPQFVYSSYLSIHSFFLLQPLPPPPKSSLSMDDFAFYLEKTKTTRRKPQETPTISVIHFPEPAPIYSALYSCAFLKQCPFPCALDLISYLFNIAIFSFSVESFSWACKHAVISPILKTKSFPNLTSSIPLFLFAQN